MIYVTPSYGDEPKGKYYSERVTEKHLVWEEHYTLFSTYGTQLCTL
jgi:hypothetical protein